MKRSFLILSSLIFIGLSFYFVQPATTQPIQQETPATIPKSDNPISSTLQPTTSNRATNVLQFMLLTKTQQQSLIGDTLSEKATSFFDQYGQKFGITNAETELVLAQSQVDHLGFTHLIYHQTYQSVPVFAGVLKLHFDANGTLKSVNGVFVPNIAISITPKLQPDEIEDIAYEATLKAVLKEYGTPNMSFPIDSSFLTIESNELNIFHDGLIQGISGMPHLAYALEVRGPNIREYLYIDAHKGDVIEQFSGIHNGLDRRLYDPTLTAANLQWSEGDAFPTGNTDWNNELYGAEETYNFFLNLTGGSYPSYDGMDATMVTVNDDPSISCPNANWNGISTNYCTNVSGDDTVSHEWGHAYTEYTSNLVYAFQAGALNESYSDFWGETIDLINSRGLDAPDLVRTAGYCSSNPEGANLPGYPTEDSVRWLSGEDDPAFDGIPAGSGNAIRDMWEPACFGDPGKVTDTDNYWCSPDDAGGVHTNSGVPNHAFALMVDGGTYNGQIITGLGLTKAAHIHWRAQTTYLTSVSDFSAHADALRSSCTDLISVNLEGLSTGAPVGASGEIITSADCLEVDKVIAAVELYIEPSQCYFEPMLSDTAMACGTTEPSANVFFEDFEGGGSGLPAGWSVGTRNAAGSFTPREWTKVSSLPDGRTGSGAYAPDPVIGDCAGNNEDGVIQLFSPSIDTTGLSNVYLSFDHYMSSEMSWDGGNLSVRVNGTGGWQLITNADMVANGYNSTLSGSPLAGQSAFTGANGGSATGSWGTTSVDLSAYASPGDSIELAWEFGTDECNGVDGWYIDNVRIHACGLCGNLAVDAGEVCDDGNYQNGDGCSVSCQIETDYSCTVPSAPIETPIFDGSFELGTPPASGWTDTYPDQDTIINGCSGGPPSACGSPSDGSWWVKFRSTESGFYQFRDVTQAITITEGAQTINFDIRAQTCVFSAAEVSFQIGWAGKYRIATGDAECNASNYSNVSIDVSNYADNDLHLIGFSGIAGTSGGSKDSFLVDNVTLTSIDPSICTCDTVTAPVDLTASLSGNDVLLNWTATSGDHQVWRSSNDPYFMPGTNCSSPGTYGCTASTTSPYTDTGAVGDAFNNYFYAIQVQNTCGNTASTIERMGEFDFVIVPGT